MSQEEDFDAVSAELSALAGELEVLAARNDADGRESMCGCAFTPQPGLVRFFGCWMPQDVVVQVLNQLDWMSLGAFHLACLGSCRGQNNGNLNSTRRDACTSILARALSQRDSSLWREMCRVLDAPISSSPTAISSASVATGSSRVEVPLYVGLTSKQQVLYDEIAADVDPHGDSRQNDKVLLQLRKCCSHPDLVHSAAQMPHVPFMGDSGKLTAVSLLLNEISRRHSRRCRVFLQAEFLRSLDLLEDLLVAGQIDYVRIDGATSTTDAETSVQEFTSSREGLVVLLLTGRGSRKRVGCIADFEILFESDFVDPYRSNGSVASRGSVAGVPDLTTRVFRLLSEHTVEEFLWDALEQDSRRSHLRYSHDSMLLRKVAQARSWREFSITTGEISAALDHMEDIVADERDRQRADELLKAWKSRYFVRTLEVALRTHGVNPAELPLARVGERACPVTLTWMRGFQGFFASLSGMAQLSATGPGPLTLVEFESGGDAGDRSMNPDLVQQPILEQTYEVLRKFFGGSATPLAGMVIRPHIPGVGLSQEICVETAPLSLLVASAGHPTQTVSCSRSEYTDFLCRRAAQALGIDPQTPCVLWDFAGQTRNRVLYGRGTSGNVCYRADVAGIMDQQLLLLEVSENGK